ncbi:hypothetical protein HK096_008141 [Nowakowskiella sp. JEL0078]|nr:hypothetical protein HK096_008141 [Nowakowskiella sp. JEL0078]
MDIWEANNMGSAYTPHVCTGTGLTKCTGTDCGAGADRYNGLCDKDGCDFNTYRQGVQSFYGKGATIDTTKVFTVVTQWITSDGTDSGDLVEIRRKWIQNGVVYETPKSTFSTLSTFNSVTDAYCNAQKTLFGDNNNFEAKGGLKAMGQAMDRGMVLVMSVWDDHDANMLWLDSSYPTTKSASTPGVARGACATTSGVPADVEANQASSTVAYSNIKWGEIGSTLQLLLATLLHPPQRLQPPPQRLQLPLLRQQLQPPQQRLQPLQPPLQLVVLQEAVLPNTDNVEVSTTQEQLAVSLDPLASLTTNGTHNVFKKTLCLSFDFEDVII